MHHTHCFEWERQYIIVLLSWFKESESDLESVVSGKDDIGFAAFNNCVRLAGDNDSMGSNGDEAVNMNTKITNKKRL